MLETAGGGLYSYADAERESARLANYLVSLGAKPGDRVTAQVGKSPCTLWLYLACLRSGLVYHPLNTAYQASELEYFLGDAQPHIVICTQDRAPLFSSLATALGITHVLTLENDGTGSLVDAAQSCDTRFETVARAPDDLAALLYSSGTTGRPKGIMLSHRNLAENGKTLVELWGFGRSGHRNKVPEKNQISALLPDIGFERIEVLDTGFLVKNRAAVTVDLSAIAKGYGVDQVSALVRKKGFENYLIEIGGEVYAAGHRKDGRRWRIGINLPRSDAAFEEVYKVVELRNQGFATSGDYRNFFEVDGVRYSHVIDPRTGFPVLNGMVSVSIITGTCSMADGLATAVMVMGVEKGLELIDRLDGVEGLIVVEQNDGTLVDYDSKGFKVVP